MADISKIEEFWDDNPIDVSAEVNFIWSIANKLRGCLPMYLTLLLN